MKLAYSPQAVADLQRLYEFIVDKSPLSARKAAIEIQESAEKLKLFPKIGLPVSRNTTSSEIRDLYAGNYTLRYQIADNDTLYVLRIWHNKEIEKDL
tara:strand:- start:695 stop:985 length:291 start_codon:yes stop_codon:yes gene_type:complete